MGGTWGDMYLDKFISNIVLKFVDLVVRMWKAVHKI